MTPDAWAKITAHFGRALDAPDRAAFVDELRRADPTAADEVASLLG